MAHFKKNFKRMMTRLRYLHISTKITCIYALVLFVILVITSIVTGLGVYISLYRQSEFEMERSIKNVTAKVHRGERFTPLFLADEPLFPGVVLRVTDISGTVIFENDSRYPSIEKVEKHLLPHPPFWANQNMEVAEMPNISIYYAKIPVLQNGRAYELHFFKTITAEKQFLATLQRILLTANLIGFLVALFAGYFLSSRILMPIRTMTQAAQRIELTNMDERIPTRPVRDELTELAKTFNHMLSRLQTGFRQQQRFVSDASHELRTPVTVILGYADLLSRWGKEDEEILNESINAIKSEAEGMQQLIEKLLFLARTDQKRQVLHKEKFELSELVIDVMKKCKMIYGSHDVEIIFADEGFIFADKDGIRQMMRIFLENSAKYTPEGGCITAELRRADDFMRLTLADNGIGIAKEHQEKIFERFYRVDTSRTKTKSEAGGTGLGLAIARWIAEQNEVTINIDSDIGAGTRITLSIPRIE